MRKIFTLLCVALCATSLFANVVTGTCGDNLQWAYDTDTKALVITGYGDMYDYDYDGWHETTDAPWGQVASKITSVSLPQGLTSIGDGAFVGCPISSIVIPCGVTRIGGGAFQLCGYLADITIPSTITSIGYDAFCFGNFHVGAQFYITANTIEEYCKSKVNYLLASIGNYDSRTLVIAGQEVTEIVIPNNITSVEEYLFGGMHSLSSITIGEKVTSIGVNAFYATSVKSMTIPASVVSIGNGAFSACASMTTINGLKNVKEIGDYAFSGCNSLRSFVIPSGVTSIGNGVFNNCYSLGSITIPQQVMSLGYTPFPDNSLVYMEGTTPPTINTNTFSNKLTVLVPCSAMDNYLAAPVWQFMDLKGYNHKLKLTDAKLIDFDCSNNTVTIEAYLYYEEESNDGYLAFKQWSDGNTDNPRTLTLTQDIELKAEFEYFSYRPRECTVTLMGAALSGRYDTEWGSEWFDYTSHITFTMPEGSSVQVTENSYCGTWLGWSDGSNDRERTIVVTSDTTISSRFDVATYSVSITAGEGGYLEYGNIEREYNECNSEWIYNCAYAYEGYYFKGWSNGNTDNCINLYPSEDIILVAEFAPKSQVQVLLGVDNASKGMGSVSGSGIFYSGDWVTITATPNAGYHFLEWSDGNGDATRKLYLQSDTTLFATFAPGEYGGKCGENLYWTYSDNTITITGSGDMDLYAYSAWHNYYENWYHNVTAVQFPEGITSIDDYAFSSMSLTNVVVPASVTYFGENTFAYNDNLTRFEYLGSEAELPGNGDYAILQNSYNLKYFKGQKDMLGYIDSYSELDTVIITSGEGFYEFYLSNISYLDLFNSDDWVIKGDRYDSGIIKTFRTLILPEYLEEIGDYALNNARYLGGIIIPAGVTRIGDGAFEDCRSMDSVVFAGKALREIGDWAFYNCHSLKTINIPEGVTEIGKAAFFDCAYLKEITLPSTTQTIADNAFGQCQKVGKMTVNAAVPPMVEAETFEDIDRSIPLYVPMGTALQYKEAEYWCEFFNVIEYNAPSAVENTNSPTSKVNSQKLLRNGQLIIIRDGVEYNTLGAKIQ